MMRCKIIAIVGLVLVSCHNRDHTQLKGDLSKQRDSLHVSSDYLNSVEGCPNISGKFFSRYGVAISEYYTVFDSLLIDLDKDGEDDVLLVLSPISLDKVTDCEKGDPKRLLVEIMNKQGEWQVRHTYDNLVSNIGGVMSKYEGLRTTANGFEIVHGSGARYSWTYSIELTNEFSDSIYLKNINKECSFESESESRTQEFTKRSATSINVTDSLVNNCGCDTFWEKLNVE